jgi:membrane protein
VLVVAGYATSDGVVLVILMMIYKLVPFESPTWRQVLPGAACAALLYEIGRRGFVFYIKRVAHLEAVYRSVFSFIVLLLWLYVSARFLLLGAQTIAVKKVDGAAI